MGVGVSSVSSCWEESEVSACGVSCSGGTIEKVRSSRCASLAMRGERDSSD